MDRRKDRQENIRKQKPRTRVPNKKQNDRRKMKLNKKNEVRTVLAILIIILLAKTITAAVPIQLSDQGTSVKQTATGQILNTGNLSVELYDADTGGTLLWNKTYFNAITNGSWNVMLGEINELNLDYGVQYFKDYKINDKDINFTNGTGGLVARRAFYSPLGEINRTFIENRTNVFVDTSGDTMTGALNISSGNLFVTNNITAYGKIGIGSTTPGYKLQVAGTINATQILINNTPIITAQTANLTGGGNTNYLSKWTGTSTLGNSLVYDDGTNVKVLNSTGSQIVLFNNTAERLEVWDGAGGTGDYLSLYHDGTRGYINTQSGELYHRIAGNTYWLMDTSAWQPSAANVYDLGTTSKEVRGFYLGEDVNSGAYFGLGQEARIWMNNTNKTLFIESTAANVSVVAPEFRVWDDARGEGDYVNIYHNNVNGFIGTESGGGDFFLRSAGYSMVGVSTTSLYPNGAYTLGTPNYEWKSLYLRENASSGIYFGVGQNSQMFYNATNLQTVIRATGNTTELVTPALRIWDEAEGANDYITIGHDGSQGLINTGTGGIQLSAGGAVEWTASTNVFLPNGANINLIGNTDNEVKTIYLGEDASSGAYFGLDQNWRLYYNETSEDALIMQNSTGADIMSWKGGNVGIGTTTPGQTLTIVGDLNVTGNSYLGNVLINAENITVTNILPKNAETGVTVRNSSGSLLLRVNTTAERTEFWDGAGGANDYVSIYHDGSVGYLNTGSGSLGLGTSGNFLTWNNAAFYPQTAGTKDLGLAAGFEWRALILGEDAGSGAYFGLDQDWRIWNNGTTNKLMIDSGSTNRVTINSTSGYVGIGTATPSRELDISVSQNGDTLLGIQNVNTGTSARAGFNIANGAYAGSSFSFFVTGDNYNGVAGWADRGVLSSDSGITGGLLLRPAVGGFQVTTDNSLNNPNLFISTAGKVGIGLNTPTAGVHVGTGNTSHSLASVNDTFVTGKLEVDGVSYFDGYVYHGDRTYMLDNVYSLWGTSGDATLEWDTAQATENTLVMGLGTQSNSMIFINGADINSDYDHPAQTNPTLFIQANEDPDANNDRWLSMTHDNSSAVIDSGYGNITLDDTIKVGGDVQVADNLVGDETFSAQDNGTHIVMTSTKPIFFNNNVFVDGNFTTALAHGTFYDLSTQAMASSGTPYMINFSNYDTYHMRAGVEGKNITVDVPGHYLFTVSAIFTTDTPNKNVELWFRKNGADIANSNTIMTLSSASLAIPLAVAIDIDLEPTDYVNLMMATDDAGSTLLYTAATGYSPATPSIILAVNRISGNSITHETR